ncbi:MAG: periplasmic heavy metal sensor, partial [Xanthomonadales bacterium]|nr:periplasmic heavy metal sensor [Xanthomonadales bacterium]
VGQEQRLIKSLSPDDQVALKTGGGWGLAKSAELNGLPGPLHLLQMSDEIGLSGAQQQAIQDIYDAMKAEAIDLGLRMIELESELDDAFASRQVDEASLRQRVDEIARTRGALRYVHLAAHLKTPDILSETQMQQYYELRGYADDPCARVPEGHDAEMWRRHNGCE